MQSFCTRTSADVKDKETPLVFQLEDETKRIQNCAQLISALEKKKRRVTYELQVKIE